jgi:hypothetical protein
MLFTRVAVAVVHLLSLSLKRNLIDRQYDVAESGYASA